MVIATLCAGLGGCASLSESECKEGDWRSIGFKDGRSGQPVVRIQDHVKACKKHGIHPDPALYTEGRQSGLRLYCTPKSGYNTGLYGRTYYNVCPPSVASGFLAGRNLGEQLRRAESSFNSAKSNIERLKGDRARIKEKIADLRQKRRSASPGDKLDIDSQILSLEAKNDLIDSKLDTAEFRYDTARRELRSIKNRVEDDLADLVARYPPADAEDMVMAPQPAPAQAPSGSPSRKKPPQEQITDSKTPPKLGGIY